MADNSYAQLIDDYENGILVEPGETLTQYIDRMGGVDYKADGGSIGIEVLFEPKREEYQTGGRTFDSRATTQDYTNALQSVSAGTTGQQQADARRYARNQATQMLNEAARAKPQARGIENIYNTFFKNQNVTGIGSNTFGRSGSGTNPDALMYYRSADRDKILDAMANQMLNTTSYAPKPKPKTYRTVSPEAQALNMSQSTYQDIISSGKDPKQYYMDYQNRILQSPNPLKYGQVMSGPGMMGGIMGPGNATPPTQAQINQMMQNNPAGYMNFDDLVKQYSSTDPYMNFKEEVKDMVGGRDTGYMSAQDYYDINVLGLDGKGIAEKYGLQYADGGRVGLFMGGDPLTGQALSIYESMNAYGFTDQEIANALEGQGLYTPGSTTTTTPVINKALNIINKDGGDGDGGGGGPKGGLGLSRFDYGYTSPGGEFKIDDIGEGTVYDEDYTLGMKLGDLGTGIRGGLAKAYNDLRSLPTPFNVASKAIGNISDFAKAQAEKAAAALAAAKARAESRRQYDSSVHGPTNYGLGSDGKQSYDSGQGFGINATTGGPVSNRTGRGRTDYKDGGLATMFKNKR